MVDRPAVVAEDLHKTFGKKVKALAGVSFEVQPGTVLGLLGPNGAGKTTSVNVLTTLLRPDSGRAEVAGVDVVADPAEVRRRIGLAGQYAAVDEMLTGRENLTLVGRLNHLSSADTKRRAAELLDRFALTDAGDRPAKTYSGGMRRRLDLAAALVARPPVLFLDEPTTGLDPRSRLGLWGVIEDLVRDGTTLLLTTQYLEEADRLADRISVIDHGRVIAEGTSSELKSRLGAAVVEVVMEDDDRAEEVRRLLGDRMEASREDETVRVPAPDGTATLATVVRALDDAGLQARGLQLREPSLDDVFLELTGKPADEDALTQHEKEASS
ncbi:ATP-binding cassette domain-containing protein [Nocardioides sp. CFH 31398]|uniref:ATP-binding cassette domain-containing protein n=1 Tax=Nocardioides sp. CFH 31398 TaxID=2919579 RepID=UPI001F066AB3|nr:ATP-binding cassette domain-containing protein [Nocardioides sp. CFH 31398]MCH1868713.1 ATP-binding cassette domain-containing protein [Nocardioides sp. CFH 31398]